ncbi:MAG: stage III sporulation protein AD [Acutalibacteraceae bacterium]|nr:stage III sporulation protein AD [Acutalibacteraceae bacterium]
MDILGICIIAVIGSILVLTLKQSVPQLALLLTLSVGVIILISVLSFLPIITDKITQLMSQTGVNSKYISILIKALGICFICQFASDICKDAGQSALASKVELAGKIMILISALPLIEEVLNTAKALLSG